MAKKQSIRKKTKKAAASPRASFPVQLVLLIAYTAILLTGFLWAYNQSFDKKIHLGGDNAGYYILGKALASGQGYTNIQMKEKPPHNHFPPGYPVILATAIRLSSDHVVPLKKLNGAFFLLSTGLLFLIVYKLSDNIHIAFLTALFSIVNYHLLTYSIIMMSEIPFMFFSLLCLYLFIKTDFSKPILKNWIFLLLLLLLSFTYYIRSTGLALFVAFLLVLGIQKRWKYLTTLFVGFILLALPWYLRNKSLGGNAYMNQLGMKNPYRPELGYMGLTDWFVRIWTNLTRYIAREIPAAVLNFVETIDHMKPLSSKEYLTGILLMAVMIFGLLKIKKHFKLIFFYLGTYFGILMLWPEVWFGSRFIIPLIPLLSFLVFNGIFEMVGYITRKIFKFKNAARVHMAIVLIGLLSIFSYSKETLSYMKFAAKADYPDAYKNYFELAKWIRDNAPDSSITSCRKGQLFHLFSGKFVTGFKSTLNTEEQVEYLKSKDVDYVVFDQLGYSSTGRYLFPAIKKYPKKFKVIKLIKKPDTYLLEFHPELGYWGAWKGKLREGKGTYTWENGQHFEGIWKEDKRNGPGILYLPGGQTLEGVYRDDLLEGEGILKDKNGQIIDRAFYEHGKRVDGK